MELPKGPARHPPGRAMEVVLQPQGQAGPKELKYKHRPADRAKLEAQKQQGDDSIPFSHLLGLRWLPCIYFKLLHVFLLVLCCSPPSLSLTTTTLSFLYCAHPCLAQ